MINFTISSAGLKTTGMLLEIQYQEEDTDHGDLDLFEVTLAGQPSASRSNGNGTFTDVLRTSGIGKGRDRRGPLRLTLMMTRFGSFITYGAGAGHNLGAKEDELAENLGGAQFTNVLRQGRGYQYVGPRTKRGLGRL